MAEFERSVANGDHEVTFVLNRPQPSFLSLFASGYTPVYPCHVSTKDMRAHPIGTGPFKFAEFKRSELVKLVRNAEYWKKGRPYLDAIEWRVIDNRSTRILAFVAGDFDMTFPTDVTIPLLKDVTSQAPTAVCEVVARYVMTNLIINRELPPFNDPKIRSAMALSLDRKALIDILTSGKADIGGVMLPLPEGTWGMPHDVLKTLPGYSADVEKSRAEGRKIMEELGYGKTKPLKVKVSTRNIPTYRDPAAILIDQLKSVYIEAELELIDTSIWQAKVTRKEYSVGLNNTGVGVDDPDVNLYENYSCNSERNYTHYCNKDLDALIDKQSQELDKANEKNSCGKSSGNWPRTWPGRSSSMIARPRAGIRTSRVSCHITMASTAIGVSRMCGSTNKKRAARCRASPSVRDAVVGTARTLLLAKLRDLLLIVLLLVLGGVLPQDETAVDGKR